MRNVLHRQEVKRRKHVLEIDVGNDKNIRKAMVKNDMETCISKKKRLKVE